MSKALNRILAAEDEPDIQSVIQIALEDIGGFTLKFCSTGIEVLENIEAFAPDLVLLDVMMPQMDGTTALMELRKNPKYAHTPIILMTAKTQTAEVAHFLSLGATQVISKPFDPMTLADKLKQFWDNHHE
jgi:two-component system OmpR family response regulator